MIYVTPFSTEQCLVEYFLLECFQSVTRVIMELNPQNPSKALNRVVSFVMKELGLQRVLVESYDYIGPNVEMYV